ncbi:MAG: tripartite tricarboxylate transporter family receptor [Hyphomicrobiales bacterium]|nr:tripartite tricarboxylate transporter family receptor [Hyphomicrobiales bacterium]
MRSFAKAAGLLIALTPAAALAQAAGEFKTMNIIVGFSPGGGYDSYARALSRHLDRYLPGHPRVIVQNMPGGSSLKAVLYLDGPSAPKDGTMMTAFNPGLIIDSLLAAPGKAELRFDQVAWVGSISQDFRVCYSWAETGIKTFADLQKYPQFNIGAPAAGSSTYINAAELKSIFGVKVRHVTGYPGSADERLAIERRELDGGCGAWSSNPQEWLDKKKINPLVTFSADPVPNLDQPVPYAVDLVTDDMDKKVMRLLSSADPLGRPYVVSRQTPASRLAILRKAFDETVADPQFVADATKMTLPVSPINGPESERRIAEIYAASDEVRRRALDAIK